MGKYQEKFRSEPEEYDKLYNAYLVWKGFREESGFEKIEVPKHKHKHAKSTFYREAILSYIELLNILGYNVDIPKAVRGLKNNNEEKKKIIKYLNVDWDKVIWSSITEEPKHEQDILADAGFFDYHDDMTYSEFMTEISALKRQLNEWQWMGKPIEYIKGEGWKKKK